MNDAQLIDAVYAAMDKQCMKRGYVAPVDVLMDLEILSSKQYDAWRFGKIIYLESVCNANLRKLSLILRQMRYYAQKKGLKPSVCCYKQWGSSKRNGKGHKSATTLRFSKSGKLDVERWYATHFVDLNRMAQLKEEENCKNLEMAYRR